MVRTVASLMAAAVLYAFTSALAQVPAPAPAPQAATPAPAPAPALEGEGKGDKHEMKEEHDGKGKGKGRGKRHSKKRGLDRADEAAGEHGKHGRDNARDRGKHGNLERHGDPDPDEHEYGDKHEKD